MDSVDRTNVHYMFITLRGLEIQLLLVQYVINVLPISLTPFTPYLHLSGLWEWKVERVEYYINSRIS